MLAAFLTTILFSISAVSGNRTARLLGGTEANFWRLCFGASLLALYAHSASTGVAGKAFPVFFVSGCVGFGVGDMALYQALPRLGSRLSVLLTLCLSAPIAAGIEWLWLGTQLTSIEIVCALVILAGVAIALAPGQSLPSSGRDLAVGLCFGLIACVCQALGAVLSRKAFAIAQAAAESINGVTAAYQRILGGVAIGVVVYAVVKHRARHGNRDTVGAAERSGRGGRWRRAWPWLLLNGLAGPTLGVSCYQWALYTTPTGVVLPIVAITPIVIIPFAYFIEHERPILRSLLGGALAVAGAVALAWAQVGSR